MLKLIIALALAAIPSIADVTAGAYVGPPYNCGGTITGTVNASESFSCFYIDTTIFGGSSGQVEVGPYGIGLTMEAHADHSAGSHFNLPGQATVSLQWFQEFAVVGAVGNGFATITG